MGQIKFAVSIVLIALFTIAVVGYAINFGNENDSAVKLSDDSTMNTLTSNMKSHLDVGIEDLNSSSQGFFTSIISSGDETTETGSSFKLGFSNMAKSVKAVFETINQKLLGGNSYLGYFITALGGILAFIGLVYIWKTWKGGNPD